MKIERSYRVLPGYPAGTVRAPRRIQAVEPVDPRSEPKERDGGSTGPEDEPTERGSLESTLEALDEVTADIDLVELAARDTGRRRAYPDTEDDEESEGTLDVIV